METVGPIHSGTFLALLSLLASVVFPVSLIVRPRKLGSKLFPNFSLTSEKPESYSIEMSSFPKANIPPSRLAEFLVDGPAQLLSGGIITRDEFEQRRARMVPRNADGSAEFMLCRKEEEDPRRCLKEGADVTNCGVKFLRKVKKVCRQEFERYAHCVDFGSAQINTAPCRKPQRAWDRCVFEHFGQERPPLGEFAKPHVHYTTRPKPPEKDREYKEAASKVIDELPADYPIRKDYKKYSRGYTDWLH